MLGYHEGKNLQEKQNKHCSFRDKKHLVVNTRKPDGGTDGAPKGETPNTEGGAMLGIATPNGGGIPGVGGMKPGGGIAYGGNADVKDPDGTTGVGILDEVGPLPDWNRKQFC